MIPFHPFFIFRPRHIAVEARAALPLDRGVKCRQPERAEDGVNRPCRHHGRHHHDLVGSATGPSGPYDRTNPDDKEVGKRDSISDNVDWDPWLTQPVRHTKHDPLPPGLKKEQ